VRKSIVGDNRDYLSAAFRRAERVELVIASGGLGPPRRRPDARNLSRDLLSSKLHLNRKSSVHEGRSAARPGDAGGKTYEQAVGPGRGEILEESRGSAPGLWIEGRGAFHRAATRPATRIEAHVSGADFLPPVATASSSIQSFRNLRGAAWANLARAAHQTHLHALAEVKTTIWPRGRD